MTSAAMSHRSELVAVAVAAFGSICVGTVPFLVRSLQTSGIDTVSLLFWRYVFGTLMLIPLAAWSARGIQPRSGSAVTGLYACGLWGAIQSFAYYKAIESVATSVAATIFFAYPIFTLILDRYLLKVDVPRSTVIAVTAIFFGVTLTSLPQLSGDRLAVQGLVLAALTPILYALYITYSYGLTRRLPAFVAAALIYGGQLTAFGAAVAVYGLTWPATIEEWLLVASIGTFGGAVQIASFAYALPRLSASGYAVIVSLELVTVVIIGVVALGEKLTTQSMLGVALVLSGVLLDRLMRAWSKRTTVVRR